MPILAYEDSELEATPRSEMKQKELATTAPICTELNAACEALGSLSGFSLSAPKAPMATWVQRKRKNGPATTVLEETLPTESKDITQNSDQSPFGCVYPHSCTFRHSNTYLATVVWIHKFAFLMYC